MFLANLGGAIGGCQISSNRWQTFKEPQEDAAALNCRCRLRHDVSPFRTKTSAPMTSAAVCATLQYDHGCKVVSASVAAACLSPVRSTCSNTVGRYAAGAQRKSPNLTRVGAKVPISTSTPARRATSHGTPPLEGPEGAMSNRSKRTMVVANAEPAFVQSCLAKWSKGLQRGAKWDKVRPRFFCIISAHRPTAHDGRVCSASLSPALRYTCFRGSLSGHSGILWVESSENLVHILPRCRRALSL